jgi:large subunit ribosomal protein L22
LENFPQLGHLGRILKKIKKENDNTSLIMGKHLLQNNEAQAIGKYVRMAPSKIRRVLRQIQGKSYEEALMLLEFLPYTSCGPIIKVLRSAVANAKNNLGLDENKIFVKEAYADQGPVMKRFRPRAQGRAYRILKPTSHITIVVSV